MKIGELKIGTMVYTVSEKKRIDDNGAWGDMEASRLKIRLHRDLDPQVATNTLWEEIMHAMLYQAGVLEQEEYHFILRILSHGIPQALADNCCLAEGYGRWRDCQEEQAMDTDICDDCRRKRIIEGLLGVERDVIDEQLDTASAEMAAQYGCCQGHDVFPGLAEAITTGNDESRESCTGTIRTDDCCWASCAPEPRAVDNCACGNCGAPPTA